MFNIDVISQIRKNFSAITNAYSIEQLNKIPSGFKNNIIWNFGHIIVTQQLLCYGLSGLPLGVNDEILQEYKKGTVPSRLYTQEDIDELKKLSKELLEKFETDYNNQSFKTYKPYTTSLNVTLNTIEDAITFNSFHEGLHLGYVMAMRKMI